MSSGDQVSETDSLDRPRSVDPQSERDEISRNAKFEAIAFCVSAEDPKTVAKHAFFGRIHNVQHHCVQPCPHKRTTTVDQSSYRTIHEHSRCKSRLLPRTQRN